MSEKSKDEIIGGVAVHEGTHATDKKSMSVLGVDRKTAEFNPTCNQIQHHTELDEKKAATTTK